LSVETAGYLALAGLLVGLLAVLLGVWLVLRTRRLSTLGRFRPQMPAELQTTVEREMSRLDELTVRVQDLNGRVPVVERRATASLQRIGIVRFNPFGDTGGHQSFVIALLDARGSGFVISSLHSRQATRVYLKQVIDGKSDTALGEEEAEAIRQALAGGEAKS